MATVNQNLSEHDDSHLPDISNRRFSIVTAEWNHEVTQPLLDGTIATLLKHGAKEENIRTKWVPGSFELSLGAQWEAARPKIDAVICLGCVIQGETPHFDYICQSVAQGMKDVMLKYDKPVIFGVLTTLDQQQALARAGGKHGNKGDEAAITAIKMLGFNE
ncbi:6,7-dimethyl-8-ribityllumazine synthase [Tunicatimonas pelagia]|uniref:6,7-dimethyl-8-ribityllumazine synthase n=1 Tax=Tunicatimonas pelagia TaxID=931531 RepID=UPI0026651661|nr:6,7-dimethyl-8-ribityllumazine synthase [Tunicatimonas pelagia]WKN42155.1 6,7-dimethyl-8-ribityllumazine synthase [Tunicatimonas pelagia]